MGHANVWGMATASGTGFNNLYFMGMFGCPNNWKVDANGKFTKDYETDQFKAAVAYQKDLYAAGVFHPNSATYSAVASDGDIVAGKFAMYSSSWGAIPLAWDRSIGMNPMPRWSLMPPFAADGGKATYFYGPSSFGITVFKKTTSDRIKEILRVFNFLGSPFGSQEAMLNNYGVKDVDFTFDPAGSPVLTTKGKNDVNLPLRYITTNPAVLYDPFNSKDYATMLQQTEKAMLAVGIDDPTIGLYSPTFASKGPTIQKAVLDGVSDIIARGRPIGDIDALVKDWRAGGGDLARTEYEQAWTASKK